MNKKCNNVKDTLIVFKNNNNQQEESMMIEIKD